MIKKLLFLYPVEEFMETLHEKDIIEKLNSTIDNRYRQKGYEINYLVFPDTDVSLLNVYPQDKVLRTDITFEEHINSSQYPSNNVIASQVGDVDEIVICGFHNSSCVRKVAQHFYDLGIDTLVDIELTDLFKYSYNRSYFNEEEYNLAKIFESGDIMDQPNNPYLASYYKLESFVKLNQDSKKR